MIEAVGRQVLVRPTKVPLAEVARRVTGFAENMTDRRQIRRKRFTKRFAVDVSPNAGVMRKQTGEQRGTSGGALRRGAEGVAKLNAPTD